MRGGDRLVHECGWMNGVCFSFLPFNRDFLNFLALATPHQPALPVPKCRQVCQLPPGGSQGVVAGSCPHSTFCSVPSASGRCKTVRQYHSTHCTPSASRSLSSSPKGGAEGASRRACAIRFLSGNEPGGLGNYRIGTWFVASLAGALRQKRAARRQPAFFIFFCSWCDARNTA